MDRRARNQKSGKKVRLDNANSPTSSDQPTSSQTPENLFEMLKQVKVELDDENDVSEQSDQSNSDLADKSGLQNQLQNLIVNGNLYITTCGRYINNAIAAGNSGNVMTIVENFIEQNFEVVSDFITEPDAYFPQNMANLTVGNNVMLRILAARQKKTPERPSEVVKESNVLFFANPHISNMKQVHKFPADACAPFKKDFVLTISNFKQPNTTKEPQGKVARLMYALLGTITEPVTAIQSYTHRSYQKNVNGQDNAEDTEQFKQLPEFVIQSLFELFTEYLGYGDYLIRIDSLPDIEILKSIPYFQTLASTDDKRLHTLKQMRKGFANFKHETFPNVLKRQISEVRTSDVKEVILKSNEITYIWTRRNRNTYVSRKRAARDSGEGDEKTNDE